MTDLATTPALRDAVVALVQRMDKPNLKKLHASITKARPLHRTCSVQPTPKIEWKPRSIEEANRIHDLLTARVGLQYAPNATPDTEFPRKLMFACIQHELMQQKPLTDTNHGARLALATAVTAYACRVCEEANAIIATPGNSLAGKVTVHRKRDCPTWGAHLRGGGLCWTSDAEELLNAALQRVKSWFS